LLAVEFASAQALMPTEQAEGVLTVLKRVAAILREADVSFALGGGLAVWAHGGPATEHDIDVVIREEDVEAALAALSAAGLKTERPPEGWLVKAWDDDVLIDLIYRPVGLTIDREFLEQCQSRDVHAVPMRVLSVEDVLVTKLLALTEHHLDYGPVLEYARSLREQVDWGALRDRTSSSPVARAFLCLVHDLRIAPALVLDGES
jgi:hypothetical protein